MKTKFYSQQGFSLLEILVALSVLALSLGVLLNIFSGGVRRAIISEEYQQAVTIAQSKLATVGIEERIEETLTQGLIFDKFNWNIYIQPFDIMGLDVDQSHISPYHVTVVVDWLAGKQNRQVQLTTLKLFSTQ